MKKSTRKITLRRETLRVLVKRCRFASNAASRRLAVRQGLRPMETSGRGPCQKRERDYKPVGFLTDYGSTQHSTGRLLVALADA